MGLGVEFLNAIFNVKKIEKKVPCSVARRQPSWDVRLGDWVVRVRANTRSEARAEAKKLNAGRRLPTGCEIVEVAS